MPLPNLSTVYLKQYPLQTIELAFKSIPGQIVVVLRFMVKTITVKAEISFLFL